MGLSPEAATNGAVHRNGTTAKPRTSVKATLIPLATVPADAPDPATTLPRSTKAWGTCREGWAYLNADGSPNHYRWRFEQPGSDGAKIEKKIIPVSYCRNVTTGAYSWAFSDPPNPRILYNLPELLARPDARVLICEGEKTAEAASKLLPEWVCTTWSGGASRWRSEEIDWSPLKSRANVYAWPDQDLDGYAAMLGIAGLLPRTTLVEPDPLWPRGWDLADALAEGWTGQQTIDYIWSHSITDLATAAERWGVSSTAAASTTAPKLKLTHLHEIKRKPVGWLWYKRFPQGKVSDIEGAPGAGKSILVTDIAARVTAGLPWPAGDRPKADPADVIMCIGEDDIADTVEPRFVAAGGDVSRAHIIESAQLPDDCGELEALIRQYNAKLLIVDPIDPFLSTSIDTNSNVSVRTAMTELKTIAAATGCAVILIRHLNKDTKVTSAMYRGAGSIALTASVRAAFLAARRPEGQGDEDGTWQAGGSTCVLAPIKANLSTLSPALGYEIQECRLDDGIITQKVCWLGEIDISADQLLKVEQPQGKRGPKGEKLEAAKNVLRESLADGAEYPSKPILDKAAALGISRGTLFAAKKELGVTFRKTGYGRGGDWLWQLPEAQSIDRGELS